MTFLQKIRFFWMYFGNPPWDTNISPPELMEFIHANPPGKALDMGCGTGTNCITLAQHGWCVTGIDFIPSAIFKARQKANKLKIKIEFHIGDVTNLSSFSLTPSSFNLILDIGCFHNLPAQGKSAYLQNLKHLLAPNGTFLLYVHLRSENSQYKHGTTEEELFPLAQNLQLITRTQSHDRGIPSAWLTFRNQNTIGLGS